MVTNMGTLFTKEVVVARQNKLKKHEKHVNTRQYGNLTPAFGRMMFSRKKETTNYNSGKQTWLEIHLQLNKLSITIFVYRKNSP